MNDPVKRPSERLSVLHRFLSDEQTRAEFLDAAPEAPDTIHQWLANLVLLTGVPFEYLVPDEKMLPQESLRFFFLDQNWIERLIDGALSIAGHTGLDQLITDTLNHTLRQPVSNGVAASIRPRLLGAKPIDLEPEKLNWPLTGFLVRSIVVDHWKGIVIENTARDTGRPLSTLRLDRPAQGILLGLYNGQLGSVTFKHPPESLHFGIDGQEDGASQNWQQKLRELDTGSYCDPGLSIDTSFRGDKNKRVIDIVGTRNAMAKKLGKTDNFGSADFAIEMIESPKSVTFKMDYPQQ